MLLPDQTSLLNIFKEHYLLHQHIYCKWNPRIYLALDTHTFRGQLPARTPDQESRILPLDPSNIQVVACLTPSFTLSSIHFSGDKRLNKGKQQNHWLIVYASIRTQLPHGIKPILVFLPKIEISSLPKIGSCILQFTGKVFFLKAFSVFVPLS